MIVSQSLSSIIKKLPAALILLISFSCETTDQREERLAKVYCASCHAFPDPALLDKSTWEKNVLPQMAFRMGLSEMSVAMKQKRADLPIIMSSLPAEPMLSNEDFESIKNYYKKNAPDSLIPAPAFDTKDLTQFEVSKIRFPFHEKPLVTLLKVDTASKDIYVGSRLSKLYQFNPDFTLKSSTELKSPPSEITFEGDNKYVSLMGIMDPNDRFQGELVNLTKKIPTPLIDSLQRPVHFERVDLNGDNLQDYIVCAFGNFTGALLAFENKGNNNFKRHKLLSNPGARKVIVQDLDHNGINDIIVLMAQGDERVILLNNLGNFNFRHTTLLRFPPVYGSSYFELIDFNSDGKQDILYTNGDNWDYSTILKPYHGVHIFLNDGNNQYTESWFHPMNGASMAKARDYDGDGDIDIATISYFPDFSHPEQGLLYFENTGAGFQTYATPLGASGRWLVMDAADIDQDGDVDLLLGALNFEAGIPKNLRDQWLQDETHLLLLRNNQQ